MKNYILFVFCLLILSSSVLVAAAPLTTGSIDLFAVTEDGKGISASLNLELVSGTGQVWSKITSLIGVSTQNTEKTVIFLAKKYADNVDTFDYKYEIVSDAAIVDGPSAGLPMGLLTVGMLEGIKIPDYVSATGTISSQGAIGAIGGVLEKTKVAHDKGIKLFFVPKSNLDVVVKDDGVKKVNLSNYAYEKYGIKVIGVDTLDEALAYLDEPLANIEISNDINQEMAMYNPPPTSYKENLAGFAKFVTSYGAEVKVNIENSKYLMNNTLLEQDVTNTMLELIIYAEKLYDDGKAAEDGNYLYSSANYFFLSNIYANLVVDVCNDPTLLTINPVTFNDNMALLKSNLAVLKTKLNYLPYEGFEWFVAAQERYLWASFYVDDIESVQVVINNQVKNVAMDKLEKYEYAREWVKIADNFLQNIDENNTVGVSVESYKESAEQTLLEIKKSEVAIEKYDLQDLDRRLSGTKEAYNAGWYLTSLYESATVLGIVNANIIMEDKNYADLKILVSSKIMALEENMGDSNNMYVWPELYLSHAKYFLKEAEFYVEQGNMAYGQNSLESSLELLQLAENLYAASKNFYDNRDVLKTVIISTEIAKEQQGNIETNKENKITVVSWGFWNIIILIVVLFLLSLMLIYFIAKYKTQNDNKVFNDTNQEISQVKAYLLELDKKYLSGRILDTEYSLLRKDYNKKLITLEKKRKAVIDNLEDLSYLESQQKYLQNKLTRTIAFYTKGLISEEEYNRLVNDYKEEITNIKYNIAEDQKNIQKASKEEALLDTKIAEIKADKKPSPNKELTKPKIEKQITSKKEAVKKTKKASKVNKK